MSEVKRGLGRGLSALLGDVAREEPVTGDIRNTAVRLLSIADVLPNPDQPRRHFDEASLEELADSLRTRGLIQPIVVRPHGGRYQIVAGERRWRAAQRAQLHNIPAIVRELDDAETLELAIIENVQRRDLNAIEEAQSYQRLVDDFGHTQEALGKLVGKSRSHVANLLRLLDLPQSVREAVADGRLSMGHARAIATATDPDSLAEEVMRRGLSVREAEALARGGRTPARTSAPIEHKGAEADTEALQRQLGDLLGLKVTVTHGPKGGSVDLAYSTLDQLDMICQRLSGSAI